MEDPNVTIQLSPKTFERIQQDPELLGPLLEELHPGQNYFESDNLNENNDVLNAFENDALQKSSWVDAVAKLMLSLVRELRPKVGKSAKLKNKKKMWETIAEKMKEEGYNYSALQIENKYRGLERTFKRTKSHNNKTGRNRETCSYESELCEILNHRPSVFPKYLVGSTQADVLTNDDLIASSLQDNEGESSRSTPLLENRHTQDETSSSELSQRKKKNTTQENILQELRAMKEQKEKILQVLENSSRRKEEIVEIMRERNNIQRDLVNAINKDN